MGSFGALDLFDDDESEEEELDPAITSDSNHMWPTTWHIPSSTSGSRFRYPVMINEYLIHF